MVCYTLFHPQKNFFVFGLDFCLQDSSQFSPLQGQGVPGLCSGECAQRIAGRDACPTIGGRFPVPAARCVLSTPGAPRRIGPQAPNVADFSRCGCVSPVQPPRAAQTASQGWTRASVTAVTDVTGNLSPIFPVTPATAVTRITGDMQLSRIPGSTGGDVDAGFIQAGSVLCKFL